MSDVAEPIQLGPTDVLAFGSENKIVNTVTPEAAAHAAELRAMREGGTRGREIFRESIAQAEHPAYTPESAEGLKTRFGGGAASLDEQGKAALNPNATAEQQAVFNEAVAGIDRLSRLLTYLQLITEPERDRKTKFQALKQQPARPDLQAVTDFDALRGEALKMIANDPSFRNMFPELYQPAITADRRRAYIEATLAADPLFRAKISERMAGIYTAAMQLPEVAADRPIQEARQRLAEQEAAYDQQVNNLVQLLKERNILELNIDGSTVSVDVGEIKQLIQKAGSADAARDIILQSILGCDVQTLNDLIDLETIPYKLAQVRTEMNNLAVQFQLDFTKMNMNTFLNRHDEGRDLLKKQAELNNQLQKLEKRLNKETSLTEAVGKYRGLVKPLLQVGVSQQNPQGEFQTLVGQAKATQRSIERIEQQIAGLQAVRTPERATQEAQRMLAERRLLGQLDTIIGEATADVMEKKYDEMLPLEQKRQQEEAKKTEEKKGARTAWAQRQIQKEMNERWIRIHPTTGKTIDCSTIAADMDLLIYEGENGLKKAFLRSLFGDQTQFIVSRVDAQGNRADTEVTWKTFDFVTDELKGEDKAAFEAVYQAEGKNYRDKLMRDFFYAQSISERPGRWLRDRYKKIHFSGNVKDLRLDDFELQRLDEVFGKDVEEALAKSKEAQQTIQRLKEKGIQVDNKEWKWLMYILIILFGIGGLTINPILGAGGIAGAVAAEKARKKIYSS